MNAAATRKIRLIMHLRNMGITDMDVLKAMERVPREAFVPPAMHDQAYEDIALPIGRGQTISQPYVVAAMTQALELSDRDKVLEIGTGSGYQTCILSHLCRRVYSIERHKPLLGRAEEMFKHLKLTNITAIAADGMKGWPEQAPFDKIICTAAAPGGKPPQALLDQLKVGGILVVPIAVDGHQVLRRYKKEGEDTFAVKDLFDVRFVPLLPNVAPPPKTPRITPSMERADMRILPVIAALFMLSACVADNSPAPTVYYYGTQGGAVNTAGIHTVAPHDTPWTIAQNYHLSVEDLLAANRLQPPYALHNGQRIILPPPATYVARPGDDIYRVSRTFNVSMTQLAQLNDLHEPFAILPGTALRLPSVKPSPRQSVRTASAIRVAAPASSSFFGWEKAPPSRHAGGRFIWPVSGPVISAYGPKANGLHNDGINIRAPRGAPVKAADDGVVVYAGNELKGFGNLVLLRHNDRWMTAYAHMERLEVRRGQTVKQGDMIGAVGSTGSTDSPQLHFEVRHGTEALNPAIYLRG